MCREEGEETESRRDHKKDEKKKRFVRGSQIRQKELVPATQPLTCTSSAQFHRLFFKIFFAVSADLLVYFESAAITA